jgi:hypothetical protein
VVLLSIRLGCRGTNFLTFSIGDTDKKYNDIGTQGLPNKSFFNLHFYIQCGLSGQSQYIYSLFVSYNI